MMREKYTETNMETDTDSEIEAYGKCGWEQMEKKCKEQWKQEDPTCCILMCALSISISQSHTTTVHS